MNIHIFVFCPTDFFCTCKWLFLWYVNMNIWIYTPPPIITSCYGLDINKSIPAGTLSWQAGSHEKLLEHDIFQLHFVHMSKVNLCNILLNCLDNEKVLYFTLIVLQINPANLQLNISSNAIKLSTEAVPSSKFNAVQII